MVKRVETRILKSLKMFVLSLNIIICPVTEDICSTYWFIYMILFKFITLYLILHKKELTVQSYCDFINLKDLSVQYSWTE